MLPDELVSTASTFIFAEGLAQIGIVGNIYNPVVENDVVVNTEGIDATCGLAASSL